MLHYGMRARRVPGLRRDEVAGLAGVSVDYYTRLERGQVAGASDSVLDALARALRLDGAEREHLTDLARAIRPGTKRRTRAAAASVRASLLSTAPIIGATRPEHLADAVAALDIDLTADEAHLLETPYTPRTPSGY